MLTVKAIFVSFAMLVSGTLFAQVGVGKDKVYQAAVVNDAEWNEGSVLMNDGTELKGLLRYNDKTGILSVEAGTISRSLTARNVMGFEFNDNMLGRQRIFYTFPYEDVQAGGVKPNFFELLKEFRDFAVLCKTDPVEIKRYNSTYYDGIKTYDLYGETEIHQAETVYFMDAEGTIQPYSKLTTVESDGTWFDSSKEKKKMLDRDLLEEFVGEEMYKRLVAYAKEHDLKFKLKEDFVKILDYYAVLLKE